jgi:pimeloyl-ACP methyl ester carboxylesterase
VTEFRNTATDWGIDFGELNVPVTLWHGEDDTNVPIADARRFEATLPEATLTVRDDTDHLGTLVESMPEILERAGG